MSTCAISINGISSKTVTENTGVICEIPVSSGIFNSAERSIRYRSKHTHN